MVTKKDLIVAVLATFCLTAMLFIVVPTKSQTAQYDPWVDLDGDGQISIYDVVQMTSIYGKTGDPAKNVSVTNWPQDRSELRLVYNQSLVQLGFVELTTVDVTGFKTIQVHAKAIGTWQVDASIRIWVFWNAYGVTTRENDFALETSAYTYYPWYGCGRTDILVTRSNSIKIYITANSPTSITLLTIAVYLQN